MKIEEQIAEFVRDNRVLWDKNHPEYKNMKAKDRQWFRLATVLGIPVDTVKRRWKTMRDRYFRLTKRQDIATNKSNCNKITRYKYGGMLHFLDEYQKKNFKKEPTNSSNNSEDSNYNCEGDQSIIDNEEDCAKYEYIDSTANTQSVNKTPTPEQINPLVNNSTHITDLKMPSEDTLNQRVATMFNNSPAYLFMLSLALQIDKANLSSESFLNLQIKMLKLVKEEIKNQE